MLLALGVGGMGVRPQTLFPTYPWVPVSAHSQYQGSQAWALCVQRPSLPGAEDTVQARLPSVEVECTLFPNLEFPICGPPQ